MEKYSAINLFLWLSPSLYKQKQKQIWFHFCWPPTDNLPPTKMKTILRIPLPSQVFHVLIYGTVLKYWYDSTASLSMILYIGGSSVRTVASQFQDSHCRFYLCRCMCMHFSCTALSWDALLRIMENDVIWGEIVTMLCHDSSCQELLCYCWCTEWHCTMWTVFELQRYTSYLCSGSWTGGWQRWKLDNHSSQVQEIKKRKVKFAIHGRPKNLFKWFYLMGLI
jgi:hypothetical protein